MKSLFPMAAAAALSVYLTPPAFAYAKLVSVDPPANGVAQTAPRTLHLLLSAVLLASVALTGHSAIPG